MKISINVDITPQELRDFFGLPDVQAFQEELISRVREGIEAGAEGFDPAALLRPMMPANMQALEAMQKAFWSGMARTPRDKEDADG